jgi:hypothetical protein
MSETVQGLQRGLDNIFERAHRRDGRDSQASPGRLTTPSLQGSAKLASTRTIKLIG